MAQGMQCMQFHTFQYFSAKNYMLHSKLLYSLEENVYTEVATFDIHFALIIKLRTEI